jgi:tetratricopeptide (TPR) repeat protein
MRPKVGVVQFGAASLEGDEHAIACGVTYEIARRLSCLGGLDANAILLGPPDRESEFAGASDARSLETATGLTVPGLGARYESDYILLGQVRVTDGLVLEYRVFEAESGRQIRAGCVNGLRTSVCRLLDALSEEVRRAIGSLDDEEPPDPEHVPEHLDFRAFVEFCRARATDGTPAARAHLERALLREPAYRVALVEYVAACYQADEVGKSLALVDAYLARYPEDQEILIAAANLCLAFHRVDEGIRYARRALSNRPGDVEPNLIMARFLFARELPADARRHLDAALGSADASADALYCLGRYFLDLADYYRARDYFEACLEAEPGYWVAMRDLQCCYYELGDFGKGIEACEAMLEADSADAGSHYNLGLIYQRLGRATLAQKYFEEAVRQDPSFHKAIHMLGEHAFAAGRLEEALGRFRDASAACPDSAEALGRVGDCQAALGRRQEAYRAYAQARRADPLWDNARFRLLAGVAHAEQGRLAEAREELLRATELDADLIAAWNELGWVLLRSGRADEALDVVRHAVDLRPEDPSLLANLLTCARGLPLRERCLGRARHVARDARARLRTLAQRGILPAAETRRHARRGFRSLTWHVVRG